MAKKHTKTANVCANIYEGEFQLSFDCVEVEKCRFALCQVMPPDGSEGCVYREHGTCLSSSAKYAGLSAMRARLTREMKILDEN